jgi:hypothetical protein
LSLADAQNDALSSPTKTMTIRRTRLPLDVNDTAGVTDCPGTIAVVVMGDRSDAARPGRACSTRAATSRPHASRCLPTRGASPSRRTSAAVVTSAWTHQVTAVDLDSLEVRWSVDVGREPRGVAVTPDGVVYVDHLVGRFVTRIDGVDQEAPKAERVDLAPAPIRARRGQTLDASLGYSLVLSPDANKLYVPRHAIGAQGQTWWTGVSTVDVLSTRTDARSLIRRRPTLSTNPNIASMTQMLQTRQLVPLSDPSQQPRAAVYAARPTRSSSPGGHEQPGRARRAVERPRAPPASHLRARDHRSVGVAQVADPPHRRRAERSRSADDAGVRRTTNDILVVVSSPRSDLPFADAERLVHFAEDTLSADAAKGVAGYDATDRVVSGLRVRVIGRSRRRSRGTDRRRQLLHERLPR